MRRILWFRRDLRVENNPLLSFEGEVFPLFIFDTEILKKLPHDDKRVPLLYSFVLKLKEDLLNLGLDLKIFYGNPLEILSSLELEKFDEIIASGDYDSYAKERDRAVSHMIKFRYIHDTYLLKPKDILKGDGSPYLVFTPFYKQAALFLQNKPPKLYERASQSLYKCEYSKIPSLDSMGFDTTKELPHIARDSEVFFKKIALYEQERDYLSCDATSHLSVALRFGLISVHKLYRDVEGLDGGEAFRRQLLFRDYYAYLLFHFPYLATHNYKNSFNGIEDRELYEKFCSAQTGVPLVDAGVRELLTTGNMHNRVRMVVASFFTKDLLLPWQWGESFFAKHLLDYDSASNLLSWQWSAGTGIDPQPYFRVFNPYLQAKKFDKNAQYIKKYIPELNKEDAKNIHNESYLLQETLDNYPKPILEHKRAAAVAIEKFKIGASK